MKLLKRLILLLAAVSILGSCTAYDNAIGTMKKTFPGRNDGSSSDDGSRR